MTDDLKARLRLQSEHVPVTTVFDEAADCIEALELALTLSRAETAAAYERAATEASGYDREFDRAAIRALATPDQTAALDAVRAEAMREAAEIARNIKGGDGYIEMLVSDTILAAIKGAKA